MSAKQFRSIEYRLSQLEGFVEAWASYFLYFGSPDQDELDASPEQESGFMEATRYIAGQLYKIAELSRGYFDDTDAIFKILKEARSLEHLKETSDSNFDRLQISWHEIYLKLNKARGKLLHQLSAKQLQAYERARAGEDGAEQGA
jgi:hypothetical protein